MDLLLIVLWLHQNWYQCIYHCLSYQVSELQTELETLPKKAQIAAGFITYLSSAPEDERKQKVATWTELAGLEQFDMRRFLSTESEQLTWKAEGLPSDDLSMENAVVILQVRLTKLSLTWTHTWLFKINRQYISIQCHSTVTLSTYFLFWMTTRRF